MADTVVMINPMRVNQSTDEGGVAIRSCPASPSTTLTQLNENILHDILSFLDVHSLCSVSATCVSLSFTASDPLLWTDHCRMASSKLDRSFADPAPGMGRRVMTQWRWDSDTFLNIRSAPTPTLIHLTSLNGRFVPAPAGRYALPGGGQYEWEMSGLAGWANMDVDELQRLVDTTRRMSASRSRDSQSWWALGRGEIWQRTFLGTASGMVQRAQALHLSVQEVLDEAEHLRPVLAFINHRLSAIQRIEMSPILEPPYTPALDDRARPTAHATVTDTSVEEARWQHYQRNGRDSSPTAVFPRHMVGLVQPVIPGRRPISVAALRSRTKSVLGHKIFLWQQLIKMRYAKLMIYRFRSLQMKLGSDRRLYGLHMSVQVLAWNIGFWLCPFLFMLLIGLRADKGQMQYSWFAVFSPLIVEAVLLLLALVSAWCVAADLAGGTRTWGWEAVDGDGQARGSKLAATFEHGMADVYADGRPVVMASLSLAWLCALSTAIVIPAALDAATVTDSQTVTSASALMRQDSMAGVHWGVALSPMWAVVGIVTLTSIMVATLDGLEGSKLPSCVSASMVSKRVSRLLCWARGARAIEDTGKGRRPLKDRCCGSRWYPGPGRARGGVCGNYLSELFSATALLGPVLVWLVPLAMSLDRVQLPGWHGVAGSIMTVSESVAMLMVILLVAVAAILIKWLRVAARSYRFWRRGLGEDHPDNDLNVPAATLLLFCAVGTAGFVAITVARVAAKADGLLMPDQPWLDVLAPCLWMCGVLTVINIGRAIHIWRKGMPDWMTRLADAEAASTLVLQLGYDL